MTSIAYPHNVQLVVTERCNLTCRHCAVPAEDSPAESELTTADWTRFIGLLDAQGIRSLTISGGEAMLRADALDLVEYACTLRFTQVCLVSNGLAVRASDRGRLVKLQRTSAAFGYHVSVDGGTAATHDWMRGHGSWARTWRNLDRLRQEGGRVDGVQIVVHGDNVDEFELVVHQAVGLGARTVVVFPFAAIGRARRAGYPRLDAEHWTRLYDTADELEASSGITIHLMGPVLADEWPESARRWPNPASDTSLNMCVGPDGSAFTCPPMRARALGSVGDLLSGHDTFEAVTARGTSLTRETCGRCKFQLLCTGVDARAPWRDRDPDVTFVDPHVVA